MKAALILLALLCAGCEAVVDPMSAVYSYACTSEQFAKASAEATESVRIDRLMGDDRNQRYSSYWLAAAIMRNCTPMGAKP